MTSAQDFDVRASNIDHENFRGWLFANFPRCRSLEGKSIILIDHGNFPYRFMRLCFLASVSFIRLFFIRLLFYLFEFFCSVLSWKQRFQSFYGIGFISRLVQPPAQHAGKANRYTRLVSG
jgi:hypothetical protein